MVIWAVAVGTATHARADPQLSDSPFKLVGVLPHADIVDGCGWNASANGDAIFSAELDQSSVRMRINGKTVYLQSDDSVDAGGSLDAVGDQWRQAFRQGHVKINAEFTVTDGSRTEVVHATGDVGC